VPAKRTSPLHRASNVFTQAKILLERNLRVLRSDKPNMRLTFGQVPILAIMVLVAFARQGGDGAAFEDFARKVYAFTAGKRPYQEQGMPVPVDSLAEEAAAKSSSQTDLISRQAAHRRGAIYFVLVAAGIWFGILGGCREVVTEKHILGREYRTCVDLLPYLMSKFAAQAIQAGIQTALLVALVVPFLLRLSVGSTIALWAILWLVAATSSALGLAISCVAPSYRAALTAVPLLMIPQLLFGGILRPQVDMPEGTYGPSIMSLLTIQRWGFEPALAVDPYARTGVMMQEFSSEGATRYASMDIIQFGDGTLMDCFFGQESPMMSLLLPIVSLGVAALGFLAGGYAFLRKSLAT
jgi:ABC-type multidrug transport system permease subunit